MIAIQLSPEDIQIRNHTLIDVNEWEFIYAKKKKVHVLLAGIININYS
jgi:hypothetical protein